MTSSSVHGYICECPSKHCGERLYLAPSDFRTLAEKGAVVSSECAKRDGRKPLAALGGVVAVATVWYAGGRVLH